MEGAVLCCDASLGAPAGESLVQEIISADHVGVNMHAFAVRHVQLYQQIALGAVFSGLNNDKVLLFGGGFVIVLGIALVLYYLSTGLFYDEESFIYLSFGKKSVTYHYRDIQSQQLYNAQGNLMVELYMTDGKSVYVHANMVGAYDFLDKAFSGWCAQRGIAAEDCPFHDPSNSCWFPPVSEEN